MLRAAAIGMLLYGLHDVVVGAADLLGRPGVLEWWANVWRMGSGAMLMLAAALVRVSMPGGLALAVAGLLGLQSISLHNDPHHYGALLLFPQVMRAVFSVLLAGLAWFGWEDAAATPDPTGPDPADPDPTGRGRDQPADRP